MKYKVQVLKLLCDGQGHQGIGQTITLCRECFYWTIMYAAAANYISKCPCFQIPKHTMV